MTGGQRHVWELLRRFGPQVARLAPRGRFDGVRGHLWEQIALPSQVRGRLLWSPANTGPLAVRRQVLTVHDLAALDHPEWFTAKFAGWYRRLMPPLARRVSHIIAVSEFTKRRLVETTGVEAEKVSVVPNGVDGDFRPRSLDQVRATRRALGIPPGRYLLSVGSQEPRKNIARLLRAWELVQDSLDDGLWLVVAGGPGTRLAFREASFTSVPSRVHLTGYVSDGQLPALYSGAMAIAFPSMYEGFGLPVLEAMACGTPAIVADNTALPETTGDAAVMVDPLSVDSIAEGVGRIAADDTLRDELARRSLARARQFTWDRAADATWALLERVDSQTEWMAHSRTRTPRTCHAVAADRSNRQLARAAAERRAGH